MTQESIASVLVLCTALYGFVAAGRRSERSQTTHDTDDHIRPMEQSSSVVGTSREDISIKDRNELLMEEALKDLDSKFDVEEDIDALIGNDEERFYDCCKVDEECECKYGFKREGFKDFQDDNFLGVQYHHKHVLLCCGLRSDEWEEKIENMPYHKKLQSSLNKIRKECKVKTSMIDEKARKEGTMDLIVLPDMIRYFNVEEKDLPGVVNCMKTDSVYGGVQSERVEETLVLVCAHHKRDKQCSTCGPRIYKRFVQELMGRGDIQEKVSVYRTSCLKVHKYAGNVIIYKRDLTMNKSFGEWYGYVNEDDVSELVNTQIAKGKIYKKLWRGRCGMKKELSEKFLSFSN